MPVEQGPIQHECEHNAAVLDRGWNQGIAAPKRLGHTELTQETQKARERGQQVVGARAIREKLPVAISIHRALLMRVESGLVPDLGLLWSSEFGAWHDRIRQRSC